MKRFIGIAIVALLALGVLAPNSAAQLSRVLASNVVGTFTSITTKVGTGTATASPLGTLFTSTTAVSTTDLLEDTLISYPLPASTLAVNGRGVRITVAGSFAANANVKIASLYFGATQVATFGGSPNNVSFNYSAVVLRASATTQVAAGYEWIGSAGGVSIVTTPGETLSGTVLIKLTGTGATTIGDITGKLMLVEAI